MKKEKEKAAKEKRQLVVQGMHDRAEHRRQHLLKTEIETHYPALRQNLIRAIEFNEYGKIVTNGQLSEFTRFLDSVGFKILNKVDDKRHTVDGKFLTQMRVNTELEKLRLRIEKEDLQTASIGFDPSSIPSDGLEFEHWVARSLIQFGWKATVSKGSGDQGVDVVAELDGLSVGIQCKLYSGSVGNKAVQEVLSGVAFYRLDHAVVISNAVYTKSARDLAQSTNVSLLSHIDIPELSSLIKSKVS